MIALVTEASLTQLALHVPACPDWTCVDLVRHIVGVAADVLGGDEPDDHHEAWTQAQVDARQGSSAADVLAEWDGLAGPLVAWMREHGSRPLNDVIIHEQDLRGALAAPGARESAGFALVRERMVGRFASAVAELPSVALVGESWRWCSAGPVEDAAVVLEAPDFDLARSLMSRRTAGQLRGYAACGDVDPYLEAFAGLGPLPGHPLPE